MSNVQVFQALKELKPPSSRRLPDSIVTGMTQSLTRARNQLMRAQKNPRGAGFLFVPTQGATSLLQNVSANRKLMTVQATSAFTSRLNQALAGGESYPVLNGVLGTIAGAASGGAGLLFTIGTTALDMGRVHQGIQAREGDELWQVEEVGKVRNGGALEVVHVGSYFLVDPYRRQTFTRGWLVHEERTTLTL